MKSGTNLQKSYENGRTNTFSYYNDLFDLYGGRVAEGKQCKRSSDKPREIQFESSYVEDAHKGMHSPRATIPSLEGTTHQFDWYDFMHNEGIHLNTPQSTQAQPQMEYSIPTQEDSRYHVPSRTKLPRASSTKRSTKKAKKSKDASLDELIAL